MQQFWKHDVPKTTANVARESTDVRKIGQINAKAQSLKER